ncbi:MAG: hypothetical protein ABI353_22035 [Isosphaeraceae bacterium]
MPECTRAGILGRVIEPGRATLGPEAARSLLALSFCEADRTRVEDLTSRNQQGLLTECERAELEEYIRANDVLSLLKLKARLSLERARSAP